MPQRVLIVDDERKLVQGLVGYFRQAGFDTLTAYDGRAALDIARRLGPGHRVVTVQVDSGLKYLSGQLYS